jgi:hypothetical protein
MHVDIDIFYCFGMWNSFPKICPYLSVTLGIAAEGNYFEGGRYSSEYNSIVCSLWVQSRYLMSEFTVSFNILFIVQNCIYYTSFLCSFTKYLLTLSALNMRASDENIWSCLWSACPFVYIYPILTFAGLLCSDLYTGKTNLVVYCTAEDSHLGATQPRYYLFWFCSVASETRITTLRRPLSRSLTHHMLR